MSENRKQDMEWERQEYRKHQMSEQEVDKMKEKIRDAEKKNRKQTKVWKIGGVAAAAIAAFILLPNASANIAYAMTEIPVVGKLVELVTFRDYQYQDDRHSANVQVDGITVSTEEIVSTEEGGKNQKLQKSAEEINAEIEKITDEMVAEFKKNLEDKEGYQDIVVKTEVISTTEDYFTLKLICYQGAGSGAEWDYFYTIDLNTGERLSMQDLFKEGADYKTAVSENIKQQMTEQMAADEGMMYWLDSEMEEWNFKTITDETSFYLNEEGNLVISFDEGEVAPMYMGVVEFTIPAEVISDIRK